MEGKAIRGFTLIELIVVVIILGVLASVGVSTMRGLVMKAKKTEAVTVIQTLMKAEKLYYLERGRYVTFTSGPSTYIPQYKINLFASLGLNYRDLDGTYFTNACYTVYLTGWPTKYLGIGCDAIYSRNPPAPKAAEVNGWGYGVVYVYENGQIFNY